MNIVKSTKTCLTKFVDFNGRASRSEFWWYVVFYALVCCFSGSILSFVLSGQTLYYVSSVIPIILLIPYLAVGARRLHDIGKSGWWLLLICLCCAPVLLFFFVQNSEGDNEYGPAPLD